MADGKLGRHVASIKSNRLYFLNMSLATMRVGWTPKNPETNPSFLQDSNSRHSRFVDLVLYHSTTLQPLDDETYDKKKAIVCNPERRNLALNKRRCH